jgi:CheY-like chemotaxis protein
LVVEFHDTGIGIEPQMLDRIFDPFARGSDELGRRGRGLGLGLAIGRAVAEAHGGWLTAASPGRGQGSTFRLELATVAAPEPGHREPPRRASGPPRPRGLRILLVEDNADTLRYLSMVLQRRGQQVDAASSLSAARRLASAGDYDLLISDIELADGCGLELMRELRERGIPGIALSGYGSEEDMRQSQAAGFVAHLVKPVLADSLDEAVGQAASLSPAVPGRAEVALIPTTGLADLVEQPGTPREILLTMRKATRSQPILTEIEGQTDPLATGR